MGSHPSGSSKLDRNGAPRPFGSAKRLATACHSRDKENTTDSRAQNEPTDSENGHGMCGRQEDCEGSVNLTSRLSGRPGSKPETSHKRVDVLVTREETVEKPVLLQTEMSVEALSAVFSCF